MNNDVTDTPRVDLFDFLDEKIEAGDEKTRELARRIRDRFEGAENIQAGKDKAEDE